MGRIKKEDFVGNVLLFICFSPLQLLVSKKIIAYYSLNQIGKTVLFYLVFPKYGDLEKGSYYIRFSKDIFSDAKIFRFDNLLNFRVIHTILSALKFYNSKHPIVFTAGFHVNYVRLIITLLSPLRLFSFDDGLVSLYSPDVVYWSFEQNRMVEFWLKSFTGPYAFPIIKDKIKAHFTIYPRCISILPSRTIFLPGMDNLFISYPKDENICGYISSLFKNWTSKEVTILLTQPLSEVGLLTKEEEIGMYEYIIEKHSPSFFLRHPGEKYEKIKKVKKIDVPWIAEHILAYLVEKLKMKVRIVGRFSSLHLHLIMSDLHNKISIILYDYDKERNKVVCRSIENFYSMLFNSNMWFLTECKMLPRADKIESDVSVLR